MGSETKKRRIVLASHVVIVAMDLHRDGREGARATATLETGSGQTTVEIPVSMAQEGIAAETVSNFDGHWRLVLEER